jgi:broad-specificity NMP kinase
MRVFITGSSGVGKTAVTNELARRGFAAFDADTVPGLSRLEISATGEPVEWPTSGFIDWKTYSWNIQAPALDELLAQHESIFLSGVCGNQDKFYDKFDALVVLTLTPEEHLKRMRSRPYRGANDDEVNIQHRLTKYATMLENFIADGFTPVDNSEAPSKAADQILRIINEK